MNNYELLLQVLGAIVIISPALLFAALGLSSLFGSPFSERVIGRCVQVAVVAGLLAAITILGLMLATNNHHVAIEVGDWVKVPIDGVHPEGEASTSQPHGHGADHGHYDFHLKFLFDRLSVPFVIMSFVLCGTIGAFATRYMHRERGFNRFFALYALFVLGIVITPLAGTIETLFAGWELVGVSSALLVAFFQERPAPVRNGLRVWTVYRISDAALLMASIVIHHLLRSGDFDAFLGIGEDASWPYGKTVFSAGNTLLVGCLVLIAAMGKSALVPFSGWLPRAMEGPTPSSAIFYGALSVHLGVYLLLRFSPAFDHSLPVAILFVVVGLSTAGFATVTGRVQTDIKCALSFASMAQVGIIVAEVGVGLFFPLVRYMALIHILGHGCLRTLQFLRAPTVLHDYRLMENAIGDHLPQGITAPVPVNGNGSWTWLYRFSLERGYLDSFLDDYFVNPFLRLFQFCDRMEKCWTDFLVGGKSRELSDNQNHDAPLEDLL
ncbi:MAG: proton-conducting transporter membrane subunit [Planctomycetaceae bacterium]